MHGSFYSGSRPSEHRLTDDDLHNVRRCLVTLEKITRMAEAERAEETVWQLQRLTSGLEGILRVGKVLLVKAAERTQRYEGQEE